MDERLRQLDPPPPPLPAPILAARDKMTTAARHLLALRDENIERDWAWIGQGGESDIRSGLYLALQALEEGTGQVQRALADGGARRKAATSMLAAATAARWELHGVLAPLDDAILDADPGDEQWTVRGTLAHVLHVHRAYPYFSSWWLGRRDVAADDYPRFVPDEMDQDLPAEETNGSGSLDAIRARFDVLVDVGADAWRDATDDDLAVRARWSGFPVTVGFRLGRWSPHIQEHTVQVEKTLDMLKRPTTEVERLVRLVYRGFGRLEASAWGLPDDALAAAGADGRSAGAALEAAADEVASIAAELPPLAS